MKPTEVFPDVAFQSDVEATLFYHHYKSILQRIRIGEDVTEHVKIIQARYPELMYKQIVNYEVIKSNGD
jgi:hypothetical protein